jgi:hypothetical protein
MQSDEAAYAELELLILGIIVGVFGLPRLAAVRLFHLIELASEGGRRTRRTIVRLLAQGFHRDFELGLEPGLTHHHPMESGLCSSPSYSSVT